RLPDVIQGLAQQFAPGTAGNQCGVVLRAGLPGAGVLIVAAGVVAVDLGIQVVEAGLVHKLVAGVGGEPELLRLLVIPQLLPTVADLVDTGLGAILDIEILIAVGTDRGQRVVSKLPLELSRHAVLVGQLRTCNGVLDIGGAQLWLIHRPIRIVEPEGALRPLAQVAIVHIVPGGCETYGLSDRARLTVGIGIGAIGNDDVAGIHALIGAQLVGNETPGKIRCRCPQQLDTSRDLVGFAPGFLRFPLGEVGVLVDAIGTIDRKSCAIRQYIIDDGTGRRELATKRVLLPNAYFQVG